MLLRLLAILLLLNALVMLFHASIRPAAAGTRDTPLCKQELPTTLASLNESSTRVKRVGDTKNEDACVAYRTYFLSAVKARLITAMCTDGPDRDRNLVQLDVSVDQANNGIASRCSS
jgi:hypothetical protein